MEENGFGPIAAWPGRGEAHLRQSSIAIRTHSVTSDAVAFPSNGTEISTSGYDVIPHGELPEVWGGDDPALGALCEMPAGGNPGRLKFGPGERRDLGKPAPAPLVCC